MRVCLCVRECPPATYAMADILSISGIEIELRGMQDILKGWGCILEYVVSYC